MFPIDRMISLGVKGLQILLGATLGLTCPLTAAGAELGGKPEKRVVVEDVSDRKDGLRILGYARQDTHMRNAALGLLEVEFIDNPTVDGWLLSASNKPKTEQAVGEGVVRAICAWLEQPPATRDYVEKARKAPGRH